MLVEGERRSCLVGGKEGAHKARKEYLEFHSAVSVYYLLLFDLILIVWLRHLLIKRDINIMVIKIRKIKINILEKTRNLGKKVSSYNSTIVSLI